MLSISIYTRKEVAPPISTSAQAQIIHATPFHQKKPTHNLSFTVQTQACALKNFSFSIYIYVLAAIAFALQFAHSFTYSLTLFL